MIQKEINRSQPSPGGLLNQSRTQTKHITECWATTFYVKIQSQYNKTSNKLLKIENVPALFQNGREP